MADADTEQYPRKFGKYHFLGPLAQGGMGALYLATSGDRGLERLLVIKTILPHLADAEYIARFRDEAKVVVNLSHGNLIPVFDAGMVAGEMFLAMEFVEGRDLRAVWNRCAKKQVAFPIDVAVHVVKELCRGLWYAHSLQGLELVHRDVSPPNVLVSFTGEVKLTDFGLASSTLKLEKTAPGIIYGKVAYMSPEQARGEKLDGRSDLYAAGIVLWELLTGRQLFPPGKEQPQDLVNRAKNPEVPAPSKRAPRVPPELDEICLRALAGDRATRYQSCDEFRQALQGWLARNAPTTDVSRISTFMSELFAEDMATDRSARADMMAKLQKRALTLPPTDEFRQIIERSRQFAAPPGGLALTPPAGPDDLAEAPVRAPGSVGRRASDRGDDRHDRRKQDNRRGLSPNALVATTPDDDAEMAKEVDLTGIVVDGRYRVVELVGEGGMGKVYLAEHVEIGRRVALKVLHPSYGRMPDLVERFRREARAASKIGHPNIVDVTDSGTTPDGSVYFVMEFLEGVELASIIAREGAIDIARALRITTQICRALAAAHAVGIIHRDLKPENVFLITRDGTADFVKVLDFGIAKTTEAEEARERRLTSPGMAMGTPEYMAPEQAAGRPADARCDVYATGAIVFEMLTGVPPYQGENFMEILTKKATIDPVSPSMLRSEVPQNVSHVVMLAMARNPDVRPQTMEAFEYELNKCLAGRGPAVAQILGMNPPTTGLHGESRGRAGTGPLSGPIRAGSSLGLERMGMLDVSGAAMSGTAIPLLPSPDVSTQVVRSQVSRKARAMLGAGVLVAGAAVATFIIVSRLKPQAQSQGTLPAARSASAVRGNEDTGQPAKVTEGLRPDAVMPAVVAPPGPSPSVATAAVAPQPVPPPSSPPVSKRPVEVDTPRAPPVKKKANGKELLELAEQFEKRGAWSDAKAVYSELSAAPTYASRGLFGQAWTSFQLREYQNAAAFAHKAAMKGYPKKAALELEADAYFKQGKTTEAKRLYLVLRETAVGVARTDLEKKARQCNVRLNLAERDGFDAP